MKNHIVLLIVTLLLAACAPARSPIPAAATASERAASERAASERTASERTASAQTAAVLRTAAASTAQASLTPPAFILTTEAAPKNAASVTPSPRPTRTPWPTSSSAYPELIPSTELPALTAPGTADLRGLILFRSMQAMPLVFPFSSETDPGYFGALTRTCPNAMGYGCLWALSPDGKRAGLISSPDFDFNMALPADGPPLLVENGFTIRHPSLQPVRLPDLCSQDPAAGLDERCDQIQLSLDGRYLGFRYGADLCGRALRLIDRQSGETILELDRGVHGYGFLTNGKVLLSVGHCEGGSIRYFDPVTRETVGGGGYGQSVRNRARTVEVTAAGDYMDTSSTLWGYDKRSGTVFSPEEAGWQYDQHPIFLPDDQRFLYQHLRVAVNSQKTGLAIETPAQIVRFDPAARQRVVLASHPNYHFRLCQMDYQDACPPVWYGDWLQVQRIPFAPFIQQGGEASVPMLLPCLIYGQPCDAPPENFALNAETGELRPWDPAALPPPALPAPTPTPGPEFTSRPIYSDPAGQFELLVGSDFQSLWMVPREGPPVQWVGKGEGFFYLP